MQVRLVSRVSHLSRGYSGIIPKSSINFDDSKRRVTLIPGTYVGPETISNTRKVLESIYTPIAYDVIEDFDYTDGKCRELCTKNPFILIGNLGKEGSRYIENIDFHKKLDLYANIVHVFNLPNSRTRHSPKTDILIIRENLEGEYSGVEHEVYPGVFESLKICTKEKTERLAKYAFETSFLNGRKKITVIHKANIMKMVDGLFLECCRTIAAKYPTIQYEEMIVDNASMQLVKNPEIFDVMLCPSLYGTIMASTASGLVGGAGVTSGAAFGDDYMLFEPGVRKTGWTLVGKQEANPTGLISAAANMLRCMGIPRFGNIITQAVQNVYTEGKYLTKDMGGKSNSTEFTERIIAEAQKLDRLKSF